MNRRDTYLEHALTQHARKRMQQRGIPVLVVQLLEQFGIRSHQNHGVQIYLDNKARNRIAHHLGIPMYAQLEKHMNAYLIERDGFIVTVGHAFKKIRKY